MSKTDGSNNFIVHAVVLATMLHAAIFGYFGLFYKKNIQKNYYADLPLKIKFASQVEPVVKKSSSLAEGIIEVKSFVNENSVSDNVDLPLQESKNQFKIENKRSQKFGSQLGNSSEDEAEKIKNYQQLLSLWLKKHIDKNLLSLDIKNNVNVNLRIQLDRSGKITYYAIEDTTYINNNIKELVLSSAKEASPYPKVPLNYPNKDSILAFIIPITISK